MAKKNIERLASIDSQIEKLKAQKQKLQAREKKQERAARTRRLIQNGALAEQYLNAQELSAVEFEAFLQALHALIPNLNQLTIEARQNAQLPLESGVEDERQIVPDDQV